MSDFSEEIYHSMCIDKNAIVLGLYDTNRKTNIPIGFIYGQKQKMYNQSIYLGSVIYVSGLYIQKSYRNRGLSSLLISNLIDKWWDKCKRFVFIHDKKILDSKMVPIQRKEISLFSTWLSFSYKDISNTFFSKSNKRDISFESKSNKKFLKRDFGAIYHIDGYTAYVHKMIGKRCFSSTTLKQISNKYPWLLWVYVPKDECVCNGSLSYDRFIYGYI